MDLVADMPATSLVGRGPQLREPRRVVFAQPDEEVVTREVGFHVLIVPGPKRGPSRGCRGSAPYFVTVIVNFEV